MCVFQKSPKRLPARVSTIKCVFLHFRSFPLVLVKLLFALFGFFLLFLRAIIESTVHRLFLFDAYLHQLGYWCHLRILYQFANCDMLAICAILALYSYWRRSLFGARTILHVLFYLCLLAVFRLFSAISAIWTAFRLLGFFKFLYSFGYSHYLFSLYISHPALTFVIFQA